MVRETEPALPVENLWKTSVETVEKLPVVGVISYCDVKNAGFVLGFALFCGILQSQISQLQVTQLLPNALQCLHLARVVYFTLSLQSCKIRFNELPQYFDLLFCLLSQLLLF